VKDEKMEKKLKKILRKYYKWIKAGYKYYSTAGLEVPSIPPNAFSEFSGNTSLLGNGL